MNRYERAVDWCCLSLLQSAYQYARWLGVFNSPVRIALKPYQQHNQHISFGRGTLRRRIISYIVRILCLLCYCYVQTPQTYRRLVSLELDQYFDALPALTVSILSSFSLVMQIRLESYGDCMINDFIRIFYEVRERTTVQRLFCGKYLTWLLLKFSFTLLGCIDEMPILLSATGNRITLFSNWCGVYLWLTSLLLFDACFVGFVTNGAIYANLTKHLRSLQTQMQTIDERQFSNYQLMQFLCQCGDRLDACDVLWAQLHKNTLNFHRLFEWQTLCYILYNFLEILMLLHRSIWSYLHDGVVEALPLMMIAVKLGNLILLIMCVDAVVRESHVPESLLLDLIYSGVDARWDRSVETFLARRQVENLRIYVLGFFELRNELLPFILSAIISYLFIMIQFGLETACTPQSANSTAHNSTGM